MLSTLLWTTSLCAISWAIWQAFREFFTTSSVDRLRGPPNFSWLLGNTPQLFNPNGWAFHSGILEQYGRLMRIRGVLGERILVTYDPTALHHILVKDQQIWRKPEMNTARVKVILGEGLVSTIGEQHRKQRKMMNPLFAINHMRELIPLFYEVTERLRTVLKKKIEHGPREIDILNWMTRTALELIGQSGMGYSFDSLEDDFDSHPYSNSAKKLTPLIGGLFGVLTAQFVFPLAAKFNLPRLKRFVIERFPMQRVQDIINVVDVMHQTSVDIIEAKKKALGSSDPRVVTEAASNKDIISFLLKANAAALDEDRLTDSEVFGQVSTFVFAGMDTTSTALSRILHLLALHPDVQDKMRAEIKAAHKDGKIPYDQLVSLPYMDAVCRETLRAYPPVNLAAVRQATEDIMLPLSKPITDRNGKQISELYVQKGTKVIVSVLGANCNPDLWGPDSYEWKPERWLKPLPEAVAEAHIPGVYSHLMTFLGGSHACIGFKFSQLEMKVVLAVLLSTFKFAITDKKISWRMTGVASPVIEGSGPYSRPQMPLEMTLVQ